MCYKCEKMQFIIALSAAATSLGDIVGGEDAQRSICNVVNEVANGLANDLADERQELAEKPEQAEATSGQQENGSGEVAAKQDDSELPPELLELLSYLRIRKNPLKA